MAFIARVVLLFPFAQANVPDVRTSLVRDLEEGCPEPATSMLQREASRGGVAVEQKHTQAPNLARKESEGFFASENDETWTLRKHKHLAQMMTQQAAMTTCPESVLSLYKVCMPACPKEEAGVLLYLFPNLTAQCFWQTFYEPSFACAFEERIGSFGDGGKWVCDPDQIREKARRGSGCLVYSIGSNGQYDFEESVHNQISDACEIHTFDMNHWSNYTSVAPPEYVNYHINKIGPPPDTTVPAISSALGHKGKVVDVFKIDCEGCEWDTYKSWFGAGIYIRQVLVELHAKDNFGSADMEKAHEFFHFLFDRGYVVFHKEPNLITSGTFVEYAFLKLSPAFSRATTSH